MNLIDDLDHIGSSSKKKPDKTKNLTKKNKRNTVQIIDLKSKIVQLLIKFPVLLKTKKK